MASTIPKLKRGPGKPIQKGQVLNPAGRPKGSRNKLSDGFIEALSADFDLNGAKAIIKMRATDPSGYIKVVAGLIPKDMNVRVDVSDQFVAAWKALSLGNSA